MPILSQNVVSAIFFVFLLLISIYLYKNQKKTSKKLKSIETLYRDYRNLALNTAPEQLGLAEDSHCLIYGIVMDLPSNGYVVTVVSFITGDASIYLSFNKIIVGGGTHESVKEKSRVFINEGEKYFSKAKKIENIDDVNVSKANCFFLTKDGKYLIQEDMSKFEDESSEYLNLFYSAQEIITQYRLIDDK